MQIQTETLTLSGRTITVSENDWDISRRLKRLTDEAHKAVAQDENAPTAWLYFQRDLYPLLAAPASGDVPDVNEAFALPRDELDLWYLAVWRLNALWVAKPFDEESKTEVVVFRDGSKIKVMEESSLPSITLRLLELEDEAILHPSDDPDQQIFNLSFYPKLVASVIEGDIPTADVLRKWPTAELDKWYEAVRRVNPDWFLALDAISEEVQRAIDAREKEKKSEQSST